MFALSRRGRVRALSFALALLVILLGTIGTLLRANRLYRRTIAMGYLRAFSQVVSSVGRIDDSMQKELYVTTPAMVGALSAVIQSEAATAQNALSELPYANVELEQTAALLARLADYSSALARSAGQNGGLSGEEQETLDKLSLTVAQLRERLDTLNAQLNDGSMTLSTAEAVEQRLSALTEEGSVVAGSEFEHLETNFPTVPTLTYDGPFSDHLASADPKALAGLDTVTEEQAKAAAAKCLGLRETVFEATGAVEGELPAYTFGATVDGGSLSVAVTRTGGRVLHFYNSRTVSEERISAGEGVRFALDFLSRNGFEGMEETYRYNNSGRLTVNFAWRQGEVLCYPDLVSVTVALDTGSILSYECTSYLSNHTERELPEPEISAEDARALVSDRLEIDKEQLALIPTDGEYEVLCREFLCHAENGQHYIVCINAATGAEQKILILLEDENGTLAI